MTEGPKVLWLADKLGYGDQLHDVGRFYLAVLPHLAGVRVIPAVLRATPGLLAQLARHGVHVQGWHLARFDLRTLGRVVQCIRRERIDVLHVHGYGASTFGRLAGWLTRTPVIVHQHDSAAEAPGYVRLLDRLLAPLTAQAIAVSETAKEFCIEGRSLPPTRVQVWHNGVTVAPHLPDPVGRARLRRALGVPEGHHVIGTIGRLTTEKGLRYLLDAAARVIQLRPPTLLLIIGEGVLRPALEAQAQRLGLAGQVRWLGERADAEELLGALDCFVLASVTEGSPFELLEAMGAGVPIVATAVGGTLDLLRHRHSGWLVPSRDPRSLADGLIYMLDNVRTRDQLARGALEAVRSYDVRQYAQRLGRLYAAVLTGSAAPAAAHAAAQHPLLTLCRYGLVGASGGALHVGTLWALVEKAGLPVLPATTAGFVVAVVNNFIWNRLWTFRSRERNVRLQFTRFLAVSLCGLAINNLSMALAISLAGWSYLWAQLATMGLVWAWNFFANTYWTFQPLHFRVPPGPQSAYPYDLSIVVPAYNEEARLPGTVEAMARYCTQRPLRAEIIVVDDGSTDRTLEVATQLPAEGVRLRLLHQPVNRGKGAAVRAGLRAAAGAYILMADADNSIPIECLEAFWSQRSPEALLIGSRYLQGRGHQPEVTAGRYWMGRLSNGLIRATLLPGVTDSQCGFKFFSAPVAKALAVRQRVERFGFDMELIAIARALGMTVREVGIHWRPISGSRVRPLRDAWRSLGELALIKWSLWSGVYHTAQRVPAAASAAVAAPVIA